ncbi:MAG TPA: anti-sigma factor [Pyrinomonadaceae bacterium]
MAGYRARKLTPAALLAVQEHVGVCAHCRRRLERAINIDASIRNLRQEFTPDNASPEAEPEHLPYEQLALYVDGELDAVDRKMTESHLAVCSNCQEDIADLRRYQAIAAATPLITAREAMAAPEEVAAKLPAIVPTKSQIPLFERIGEWWRSLFAFDRSASTGALIPAGMVAAVLALLVVGIWLAMRPETQNDNKELAKVETANRAPSPVDSGAQRGSEISAENRNSPNMEGGSAPASSPVLPSSPSQPQEGTRRRPSSNNSSPPLSLNDGGEEVAFDGQGNLNGLESLPSSVRQAVRRSIQSQRAQTPPTLAAIAAGDAGVLMSGSAEFTNNGVPFALVYPVGKVVRESRPTLRWHPLAGAKRYTVAVVDANFNVVAQSPGLNATAWTLDKTLPRGTNYTWQVTAIRADGSEVVSPISPAPQARFRVMDKSAFDEVTRLEQAGVRSHLARGVTYAGAGLLDEARAEFEALIKENPRSQLARKLLDSVKR